MNASSRCKHLRSKAMYIPALAREHAANAIDEASHSSHCWCNCTLSEVGPDDLPVGPERCQAGRSCFED